MCGCQQWLDGYSSPLCVLFAQLCLTLRPHGRQPARLLRPWNSPGKNTGVGCHFLLQGIFSTQGSNVGLPHGGQILYCLSHQRGPSIKEKRFKMAKHLLTALEVSFGHTHTLQAFSLFQGPSLSSQERVTLPYTFWGNSFLKSPL